MPTKFARPSRCTLARATVAAVGALAVAGHAQASVNFSVNFNDPGASYASYYTDIQRTLVAAGNDWIGHFGGTLANTTLTVSVGFASIPTANGASATSSFVAAVGGLNVFEQGAAHKLKTGIDDNGATADILFNIGVNGYLQNELWFDPDPVAQVAGVPITQTDARSVFLHEFGHAWGFNGWRNGTNGTLPGNYESTFDQYTALQAGAPGGPTLFFTGSNAVSLYGGAVPVTYNNYSHIGNNAPRAGTDLVPDLMNGVVYYRGTRYQISALDLAMLLDAGLPVLAPVPEPGAWLLMLAGVAGLSLRRQSTRASRAAPPEAQFAGPGDMSR